VLPPPIKRTTRPGPPGADNIFKGDRYQWGAQVNLINLTNNYVLYNFLSTFSGTHYVTPRTITGQLTFHF
jgi:hypothetical protein